MSKLVCSIRDSQSKPRRLRREGKIPGIVYGRHLDKSISVQMDEKKLVHLLKHAHVGSQVTLEVGKDNMAAMIKDVSYSLYGAKLQHIDFQVLTSGEKIKSSAALNFINKDDIKEEGSVQEHMTSIEYEALPENMVEEIEVDLSLLTLEKDIKVSDLPIASDKNVHLITDQALTIVNLVPLHIVVEEEEEEGEEAAAAEPVSAEVPVIGEEE